ncbi:MAG: hypothetical protein ACI89T_001095, partial [Cognaticolwellia sp.]
MHHKANNVSAPISNSVSNRSALFELAYSTLIPTRP